MAFFFVRQELKLRLLIPSSFQLLSNRACGTSAVKLPKMTFSCFSSAFGDDYTL